ncbi:DUF4238 domain-containing protein [Nocardioides sp. NPDC087217]|uniref:DUF4238 domain-containing protein n=1 Tax=Nocardioides sp. NPDC087217 TaxID=3364335 RepID=UPI00381B6E5B
MAKIDPKRYVGAKHHVVPKFILKRFANAKDQVLVRDRATGGRRLSNIKALAVTDFYTFIDQAGELNSSFEQLWGVVEGAAADILRDHLDNPFSRPRPFDQEEKQVIDAFVALQLVRGPSLRRVYEVVADYGMKLVNQDKFSADDLDRVEFRAHQNHHLEFLASNVEMINAHLATRAACLVTLDQQLLVISDEPVCLERPADFARPTRRQMRGHPRNVLVDGEPVAPEDLIQLSSGSVGLANAEAIAMPISPLHAIVYDQPESFRLTRHVVLTGKDAAEFANDVNQICMEQAVVWIAGNPGHPTLSRIKLPRQPPPVVIRDGGSRLARQAHNTTRRKPVRLDKTAQPAPESSGGGSSQLNP